MQSIKIKLASLREQVEVAEDNAAAQQRIAKDYKERLEIVRIWVCLCILRYFNIGVFIQVA